MRSKPGPESSSGNTKPRRFFVTKWVCTRGIISCQLRQRSSEYASGPSSFGELFVVGKDAFLSEKAAKARAIFVLEQKVHNLKLLETRLGNMADELRK